MADHSHTYPADLLMTNWAAGKTAAIDISVTSLLNTHTLMEAGVSAGYAALATEGRKHRANDAKYGELRWLCVPLVAETYGAWGNKAIQAFSQLASQACYPYMQTQVGCTFRNLWKAQPPSSEGQRYCHPHQMYNRLCLCVYSCNMYSIIIFIYLFCKQVTYIAIVLNIDYTQHHSR